MANSVAAKKRGTTLSRYEIAKAEGHSLALTDLYAGFIYAERILKARHRVAYGGSFQKSNNPSHLEVFANADDVYLKRASGTTLEGMAREFFKLSEHMEREQIKANPPVYDLAYVERAQFTIADLYNDIVSVLEFEAIYFNYAMLEAFGAPAIPFFVITLDWLKYREERRKFSRCTHMFCLNMFAIVDDNIHGEKSKRVDSRYCCDACRKAHHDAKRRFKENGSYLPIEYYAPIYEESVSDRTRRYEVASKAEKIEAQQAKRKIQSPVRFKRPDYEHGEVVTYSSLEDAEKAEEKREKVDIIAVYRQIIRRANPYITERARDALKFLDT